MNQVSTTKRPDTGIASIDPTTLYVSRIGGGSVSVTRYDDRNHVAAAIGRRPNDGDLSTVVVHLSDVVPEDRCDSVYMDADQTDELGTLDRAIEALQVAREAFARTKVTA